MNTEKMIPNAKWRFKHDQVIYDVKIIKMVHPEYLYAQVIDIHYMSPIARETLLHVKNYNINGYDIGSKDGSFGSPNWYYLN